MSDENIKSLNVTKELEFSLTDPQRLECGKAALTLERQIDELQVEAKDTSKKFKDDIAALDKTRVSKMQALETGKEERTVDCIMEKNFATNGVRFLYEGKVIEERAMSGDEREADEQIDMTDVSAAPEAPTPTDPLADNAADAPETIAPESA